MSEYDNYTSLETKIDETKDPWRCPYCWQFSEGMNPKGKTEVCCSFCGLTFEVEEEK